MGALSIALAKAATEAGVEIKTDSDVDRVLVVRGAGRKGRTQKWCGARCEGRRLKR